MYRRVKEAKKQLTQLKRAQKQVESKDEKAKQKKGQISAENCDIN